MLKEARSARITAFGAIFEQALRGPRLPSADMAEAASRKFGTFTGVFTPTLLTILGVIMYVRLPWVVGNAGLLGAFGGFGTAFIAYSFFFSATTEYPNGMLNSSAYPVFAVFASLFGGAIMVFSSVFTMSVIPRLAKPPADLPRFTLKTFFVDARSALSNRNYLVLLIGYLLLVQHSAQETQLACT